MSRVICIAGESGSGKTTSMRNLDPKTTFYIDADGKGLSWKGWRKQYCPENKNYKATDDANVVRQYIKRLAEGCPQIKVIVVDTINGLMVADEMRRSKEKGYDKWVDLAACVWDMVCEAYSYRDDLTIVFTAHTQTDHDENGYMFTRIKTSGKKLDKIVLESKFTTVLLSKCVDGEYKFETQANNSTAKSPMGAFEAAEIDNDIVEVIKTLEEFLSMQKPSNYENTQASGEYTPIELGGHILVIKEVLEMKSKTGKDMLKISFDFAKEDKQAGYFEKAFRDDIRPDKKWPNAGTTYLLTEDQDGNCSRQFKTFTTSVEKSNKGFSVVWGDGFEKCFKNKKIGGVFGSVHDWYNDRNIVKRQLRWFRSTEGAADADIPDETETKAFKANNGSRPAPVTDADGFMSIPDGIDEELPFN